MEKKSNTGLIIALSVAFAVVFMGIIAAVAFFVGGRFVKSPEVRMTAGFANMMLEIAQYDSSLSEEIDFAAIEEYKKTGTIHTDTDVSITVPESEIGNMSFNIDALTNISQKKANCDIGVGVYGFEVQFADIAATSDTLYISLPMFLKDTYSLGLTQLGKDFNNSQWAKLLDTELPEDYSIALFESSDEEEEPTGNWNQFYQTVKENVRYQNIAEKKDGCTGVRTLLEQEAANLCVEALAADMRESASYEAYQSRPQNMQKGEDLDKAIEVLESVRFETDCMLDFYFDNKGRIVNIVTPADIEMEDGSAVSVEIVFSGEERVLDVIEGNIYVKDGGSIYYIGIDRNADVSDTLYSEDLEISLQTDSHDNDMLFSYQNEFGKEDLDFDMEIYIEIPDNNLRLQADGEFTDIVKGESYTFRINNAKLEVDDENLCYASVVSKLEPSNKDPEIPDDAKDLLTMDTSEIQMLIYEALSSLRTLNYD
ncbi:MAG: hypothetical protein HDR19_04010 [Lachnospiraceae bacterium]|nr:hypothetical protein [Lachnospiraceae bacterium]